MGDGGREGEGRGRGEGGGCFADILQGGRVSWRRSDSIMVHTARLRLVSVEVGTWCGQ